MIYKNKGTSCIQIIIVVMISLTQFHIASALAENSGILFTTNINDSIGMSSEIDNLLNCGSEFIHYPETTQAISNMNVKRCRLINVDAGNTAIIDGKIVAARIDADSVLSG